MNVSFIVKDLEKNITEKVYLRKRRVEDIVTVP